MCFETKINGQLPRSTPKAQRGGTQEQKKAIEKLLKRQNVEKLEQNNGTYGLDEVSSHWYK